LLMLFLQEFYFEIGLVLLPWLVFLIVGMMAAKLLSWARGRKGGAIVFGVLVQMFLPDPYVERTIAAVIVEKKIEQRRKDSAEPHIKDGE